MRVGWAAQGDGKGLLGKMFWMEDHLLVLHIGAHLLVFLQAWYPSLWLLHSLICFPFQLRNTLVTPVVKLLSIPH